MKNGIGHLVEVILKEDILFNKQKMMNILLQDGQNLLEMEIMMLG